MLAEWIFPQSLPNIVNTGQLTVDDLCEDNPDSSCERNGGGIGLSLRNGVRIGNIARATEGGPSIAFTDVSVALGRKSLSCGNAEHLGSMAF